MQKRHSRGLGASRRQVLGGLLAGFGAALAAGRPTLARASTPAADYANELWAKTVERLSGGGHRSTMNLHSWEGYTEEPVLDPFQRAIGASVNPQMLISDPSAVNNLRSGGTSTWDVINLNNSWARKMLYPEGLILPLDTEKFQPLYGLNRPAFQWPYNWAMDNDGNRLLGMIQRYGPSGMGINAERIDPRTVETGGYMEMIEGAKGQYGVLDYEDWVIMHTCLAAGMSPFRKFSDDDMATFKDMIFKVFANAKKISDDQAALARDMITGEIVGTFPGSVYTTSAARFEGETQIRCVVPEEGVAETRTAANPKGKSGVVWIEVTSLVANPSPTPLAEAFLIYCHTPDAAYRVAARAPGTMNPVVQMGDPSVIGQFAADELEAIHWGEDGSLLDAMVDRCLDFDVIPDYTAMHDLYTEAKRTRGL